MDMTMIEDADRAQRVWQGEEPGPIRIGSDAHKRLMSRMLLDTFNPYKPAVIDWPELEPAARERLIRLPIWDIAVRTEGKASLRVKSYADLIDDKLLKEAVELNGFEEARHKQVLANLVQAYGIKLEPEPPYVTPRYPEWAFMVTGYSECIDSFFAFGLFETAKRSGFFPPALVDTFEPVMQEEGRHITFFVNWVAWYRKNLPWWRKPLFQAKIMAVWAFLAWERMSIARGLGGRDDNNFTVTGASEIGVDINLPDLMDICLAENDRRLAGYDSRLLRPGFFPGLVRLARRFMGKKKDATVAVGSEAHKALFCRDFMQTYQHFDPETLPWPELTEAELQRLRSVPFWQEVLHTERRAGAIVRAFSETIRDPVLKEAIDLQGVEETRHADLIRVMIRRYGIDATERPLEPLPADIETAFKDFGFGECTDAFLGFGVFKIARQSSFLPESMFQIFDNLMLEETRHIVFFINWMAYQQVIAGKGARWRRALISLHYYIRAAKRLAGTASRGAHANDGRDFAATQASVFLDGFTVRRFLEDCSAENVRRMSVMDRNLLRPAFLPSLAEIALGGLRLWDGGRRAVKGA